MSSTLTIYANAGDCYSAIGGGSFNNTDTTLAIADVDSTDRNIRTWISFTVPLAKNQPIISADLFVVAAATSTPNIYTIAVGCEDATSPAAPVSGAQLIARTVTGAQNATLEQYVNGNTYHYDVDSGVAAVLSRSDWVYGSSLACIVDDVDTDGKRHVVYSSRNGSSIPYLVITVPSYVPRSGGWW